MTTIYDANAGGAELPPRATRPARADYHDLPDLYEPSRRRLHPMLVAGFVFIGVSAAFYGAEATLPPGYKPSHFIGGYTRAIAQARSEGELAARIGYDGRLKVIETAAVAWQERCRAGFQNFNNLYQAAYQRANTFAQATVDMQKQYASVRYNFVQSSLGGEMSAANMATSFGYIFGLFDPELGRQSMEFAEAARQQALSKLDDTARSGMTISIEGWDSGLPDPSSLPAPQACELPTTLVSADGAGESAR